MLSLILKVIQWIIAIGIVILDIALIEYVTRAKSKGPTRQLRKNAYIKKYKINKKILYKIIPKENMQNYYNIIYFHGGAYSGGLNKVHWNFIERISEDTHANIFVPDYPLIPKSTYEDVFNMADTIYEECLKENKFIIIGDSAGGGISLAFSQKLGEENKQMPEKIVLISPWLDITMKNEDIDYVQESDKLLNKNLLKIAGEIY